MKPESWQIYSIFKKLKILVKKNIRILLINSSTIPTNLDKIAERKELYFRNETKLRFYVCIQFVDYFQLISFNVNKTMFPLQIHNKTEMVLILKMPEASEE